MDSLRQHQSDYDPLFFVGPMFSHSRRRGSTSQMCLHKILSIIATVPPPLSAAAPPCSGSDTKKSSPEDDENKGSGFDLNVVDGFCASPERKESFNSGLSSSSTTALEGGGSAARGGDRAENEERGGHGASENSRTKIEEAEKSLTLLIEAATLIFGEFMDGGESEPGKLKKDEAAAGVEPDERKLGAAAEMGEEFEEPPWSPVVRSKRGRTQVLPGKFRDSVLEPLTRFSRTRSSILPSKRRRR